MYIKTNGNVLGSSTFLPGGSVSRVIHHGVGTTRIKRWCSWGRGPKSSQQAHESAVLNSSSRSFKHLHLVPVPRGDHGHPNHQQKHAVGVR
jgi:hypothetical protein